MKQINQPIEDKKFKVMFDIDQKLYEQSSFLRSIKSNYLRFGSLSEKQVETFKRVAAELANPELKNKNNAQAAATAAAAVAVIDKKEGIKNEAKKAKPKAGKPKK